MKNRYFNLILCTMVLPGMTIAQIAVPLLNPSFEISSAPTDAVDRNAHEVVPSWENWAAKNFPGQDPPEVYSGNTTRHIHQDAQDGDTYIGLTVRKNDSWESIGQELQVPLAGGQHYSLSLYLCLDPAYAIRAQGYRSRGVNYDKPVIIRIRGASAFGESGQVLAESDPVQNKDWKVYYFDLYPEKVYRYLIIEAFYVPGTSVHYMGHVLIDNARLAKYL